MGAKPNSQAMTNSTKAPLMMALTASNIPAVYTPAPLRAISDAGEAQGVSLQGSARV